LLTFRISLTHHCKHHVIVRTRNWAAQADQEKILALLASWSVHRKPTAKRRNFSIEKVLSVTKKGSKSCLSVLK